MESLIRYRHCFTAGCCAALGSFFGKLSNVFSAQYAEHSLVEVLVLRVLPIALMLVFNVLNMRYFLRALQSADQTLTSTVLTAASNYTLSFVLGVFVFHEMFSFISILGMTSILAGLWFLCEDKPKNA